MSTRDKLAFAYMMGKYSGASVGDVRRLMRLGSTHIRLETELANGYKRHTDTCMTMRRPDFRCCNGVWDAEATDKATRKCERIDAKMEAIAKELGFKIEYGALTVRVVFADGREAGIP